MRNAFEVLGLREHFLITLEELEQAVIGAHVAAAQSPQSGLETVINTSYAQLKNPLRRAQLLLERCGWWPIEETCPQYASESEELFEWASNVQDMLEEARASGLSLWKERLVHLEREAGEAFQKSLSRKEKASSCIAFQRIALLERLRGNHYAELTSTEGGVT